MRPHTLQERFINPSLKGRPLTPSELEEEQETTGAINGQRLAGAWRSDDNMTTRYRLESGFVLEIAMEDET